VLASNARPSPPTKARVEEFGLKEICAVANGTIRNILGGVIFRSTESSARTFPAFDARDGPTNRRGSSRLWRPVQATDFKIPGKGQG